MKLYLVQHGYAYSKEEDPDRRLTEQGRNESGKMAEFLSKQNIKVDAIWHSGKPRAQETAEILSSAFTSEKGVIEREGLKPKKPVGPIKKEIEKSEWDLVIVGHMPFLGSLASALITGNEEGETIHFRKSGVFCLERMENEKWAVNWAIIPEFIDVLISAHA